MKKHMLMLGGIAVVAVCFPLITIALCLSYICLRLGD